MAWDSMALEERLALVEDTWKKVGRRYVGHHRFVWVRTVPFETMTPGGLHLPPKLAKFHGEISAHKQIVRGVVLSPGTVGVATEFEVGDVVEFQRLQFGYIDKLDKDTQEMVGFIDANQILWKIDMPSEAMEDAAE